MFEVGQKVWDVVRGEGVVDAIESETPYPLVVRFVYGGGYTYTTNGKSLVSYKNRSLYPYPVEVVKKVVKPSINWEHVSSEFNYLAEDADGGVFLYEDKPFTATETWTVDNGELAEAHMLASYTKGACDWKESLIERPKN